MNIEKAEEKLEKLNQLREEIFTQRKKVIRHCAKGIRAVHTEDYDKAYEELGKAKEKIKRLQKIVDENPTFHGRLNQAYQEIVELEVLLSIIEKKKLPELEVPPDAYLTGVLDALGEMKRRAMSLLMKGEYDEAMELYEKMEETYYSMEGFSFPNSLVGGFKRKQDVMKRVIEGLYETLAEAKMRNNLSK